MLVVERNGGVHGSLRAIEKGIDVSTIAKIFGGGGHDMAAAFHLDNTTLEREQDRIIGKIKDYQSRFASMETRSSAMPELAETKRDLKPGNERNEEKGESEQRNERDHLAQQAVFSLFPHGSTSCLVLSLAYLHILY